VDSLQLGKFEYSITQDLRCYFSSIVKLLSPWEIIKFKLILGLLIKTMGGGGIIKKKATLLCFWFITGNLEEARTIVRTTDQIILIRKQEFLPNLMKQEEIKFCE
jgi:hypothetical protein